MALPEDGKTRFPTSICGLIILVHKAETSVSSIVQHLNYDLLINTDSAIDAPKEFDVCILYGLAWQKHRNYTCAIFLGQLRVGSASQKSGLYSSVLGRRTLSLCFISSLDGVIMESQEGHHYILMTGSCTFPERHAISIHSTVIL